MPRVRLWLMIIVGSTPGKRDIIFGGWLEAKSVSEGVTSQVLIRSKFVDSIT